MRLPSRCPAPWEGLWATGEATCSSASPPPWGTSSVTGPRNKDRATQSSPRLWCWHRGGVAQGDKQPPEGGALLGGGAAPRAARASFP